jgi:predicted ATPase
VFISRLDLEAGTDLDAWPFTLAPMRALAAEGLEFTRPVTFLVGENGSGKSTLVEAIADAVKINSYGGKAGTKYASTGEKTPLGEALVTQMTTAGLRLVAGPRTKRSGFFLRAETLFDLASSVSGRGGFWEDDLELQSHGEGFFTVFEAMFSRPGLYLMDEPEAALSFRSCLRLVGVMHDLARSGSQIICATHSPILTTTPDADIIELSEHGLRRSTWDELELIDHWRRFMARPDAYLRHIVTNDE